MEGKRLIDLLEQSSYIDILVIHLSEVRETVQNRGRDQTILLLFNCPAYAGSHVVQFSSNFLKSCLLSATFDVFVALRQETQVVIAVGRLGYILSAGAN